MNHKNSKSFDELELVLRQVGQIGIPDTLEDRIHATVRSTIQRKTRADDVKLIAGSFAFMAFAIISVASLFAIQKHHARQLLEVPDWVGATAVADQN